MLIEIRLTVLAASCAIALATAQTSPPRESRVQQGREFLGLAPPPDPAAAERGQKLFAHNCAFCHGANATGAEGPDLVRSTVVLHDDNGEMIGAVVLKGRPDQGMPAFPSFTPEQIQDLAAFLHSRVEAAANRWTYKVLNVVTGDPKRGEAFFTAHCVSCHSPAGDLAHIAAKFEPVDLQTQFLYPKIANPTMVTVTLPSGEEVKGRLKQIDDFTVSLWDKSGNYREWNRSHLQLKIEDPLAGHRDLLPVYSNADMHNVLAYLETLK